MVLSVFIHAFPPASGHSKTNEDLKQENSELQEKLRVLVTDKEASQLRVEELQKKLEMSELLLQQVRAWAQGVPPPPAGARPLGSRCVTPARSWRTWILVLLLPWNPPDSDKKSTTWGPALNCGIRISGFRDFAFLL